MRTIGLDIGGANLKAADNDGRAVSRAFALWREPERLADELVLLLNELGREPADRIAVTMTAELCDCFETKEEGVDHVLTAVESLAHVVSTPESPLLNLNPDLNLTLIPDPQPTRSSTNRKRESPLPITVWQTGGEFVPPALARELWQLVAAANWHALATFCGRMAPRGSALLIDVGSTTTDIIPLLDGIPVAVGMTDFERLASGELVYTGVRRTPVASIAHDVRIDEQLVGLSSELFATMQDVYLLLDDIAEEPDDCDTADGRPATKPFARGRLARMLCCDRTELSDAAIEDIALQLASIQCDRIASAIERVVARQSGEIATVIISGEGTILVERVLSQLESLEGAERVSLPNALGAKRSTAACAFAVAKLAAERC